ncbi:MAG: gamma-glutamyl-gamma-aminobutyrate hydrolase family protein [Pseudomonadota bacterium]
MNRGGACPAPRIGVSACIMHADPTRPLFKGKTLLYAEESMLAWIMSAGAVPVLLPRASGPVTARDLLEDVDGLVLQGGVDMSPGHYGEEPARAEWTGDGVRDAYEMELVHLCLEADKPVLGVCRGAQVLNVALGGSLYQDIETQHEGRRVHRNWDIYDQHTHDVVIEPGARLARWYGFPALGGQARINSVHHQGLKRLGRGLVVEARSAPDGVVEAVRFEGRVGDRAPFAYGVQWHPEFLHGRLTDGILDPRVLLDAFLTEVCQRKGGGPPP